MSIQMHVNMQKRRDAYVYSHPKRGKDVHQSTLKLEPFITANGTAYRTTFKNQHGRGLYMGMRLVQYSTQ